MAPANSISNLDYMKLVKDALAEHATLSSVFLGFALGSTIPLFFFVVESIQFSYIFWCRRVFAQLKNYGSLTDHFYTDHLFNRTLWMFSTHIVYQSVVLALVLVCMLYLAFWWLTGFLLFALVGSL